MRIAIIGGGIVGLTTALSLCRVGLRATVYEAVAAPAPLGVGINLLPHAVRELTELGLLEKLLSAGVSAQQLVYRMADGREVWREPRGTAAGYAWPQVSIHRGQLQMLLLDEVMADLGEGAMRFGHVPSVRRCTAGGARGCRHWCRWHSLGSQAPFLPG
jgi:2-polyprenyl-6-methoxyphenol hydroxylase-like FAD-dependent oxidoreductase